MSQRILVVDDDRQIARLVQSYLQQSGFTVLTAYDGEEALHAIRREKPDLVVLDLMLPQRDGLDITRLVRSDEALAAIPILMLTARVEDVDKLIGLELGADDYLTKPFNPPEVVARVKAFLRRSSGALKPPAVVQIRGLRLDLERHTATIDDRLLELTPTEFDLLRLLMQNPGRAFTRGELIEKTVGHGYEGLDRTVDSHIKNLRKKIEADPARPEYLETVFGVGYRLQE
jgi:two-component system, OmpR family, alkaline phosphatase synthesis response regulator PhoP